MKVTSDAWHIIKTPSRTKEARWQVLSEGQPFAILLETLQRSHAS
jgi:hypothetical protein